MDPIFRKVLSSLMLFVFCVHGLQAQEKFESERDIKKNAVPQAALDWMKDSYETKKKVRWILEESNEGKSYEAKLKYKKQWHSVEFDESGSIEDIEVEIELSTLSPALKDGIEQRLSDLFERHRIMKLQRQYNGTPDDLEDLIDENEDDGITKRFEIEVIGKKDGEEKLWEVLLEDDARLIQLRPISQQMDTNLNF